jgi:carbamoyltransferase
VVKLLGISHSHYDPSAALVVDGEVVAFVEEERLVRTKHAPGAFPVCAIDFVLKKGGLRLSDLDFIVQAWDCNKYDDGTIARHYSELNARYPTDEGDRAYQSRLLAQFSSERQRAVIERALRRHFGARELPPVRFVNHHFAHACSAYLFSGMDDTLVLTLDGSGEEITTTWSWGHGPTLELLHEIKVPHSLGWLYSAFTEYLGFEAYDGEYKVMGLAAYGRPNTDLAAKLSSIVWYDEAGGFETDPMLLSGGPRHTSHYFPDRLPEFMGRPPRSARDPVDRWHEDCAFAVQHKLEDVVREMVRYWTQRTGVRKLCLSGGVGMNVKMNGNLFQDGLVDDLFVFPLCSDMGHAIDGPLALEYEMGCVKRQRLTHLYCGTEYNDDEVREILSACKLDFHEERHIEKVVAQLVADGKVVGWFQGRMEGGPRALGARSILADPRRVESRDRVNEVIKYREPWRPFCPSMTADAARRYLAKYTDAPFMITTFRVNEDAKREIPAVVHVDGTTRPQIVSPEANPKFHRLLQELNTLTGIPVVLNTSFNIKGEPIVCTPQDAIRTTFATGLDALAIGDFLVLKKGGRTCA